LIIATWSIKGVVTFGELMFWFRLLLLQQKLANQTETTKTNAPDTVINPISNVLWFGFKGMAGPIGVTLGLQW